jgi:hypothetical protein
MLGTLAENALFFIITYMIYTSWIGRALDILLSLLLLLSLSSSAKGAIGVVNDDSSLSFYKGS